MNRYLENILAIILLITICGKSLIAQIDYQNLELKQSFNLNQEVNYENINTDNNLLVQSGIAVIATGLLFIVDHNIREALVLKKNQNSLFLNIGHEYGESKYNFGFAGALYLSQFIFEDYKTANAGKVLFQSLVVSGLISISIKYIIGRSRPDREEGNTKFNWFETKNTFNSFPSGHVITAFTTSTVLSKAIDNKYASILLYGLAGLTAYQRISSDNHWFSDVFFGASVGFIVGQYFSDLAKNRKDNSRNYSLIPFFSKNMTGISFHYNL